MSLDELNERLNQLQESLQRIENCLLGDEKFEQEGLLKSQVKLKSRVTRLEWFVVWLFGASAAISCIYAIARDFFGR